jgi:hypothetical protein
MSGAHATPNERSGYVGRRAVVPIPHALVHVSDVGQHGFAHPDSAVVT